MNNRPSTLLAAPLLLAAAALLLPACETGNREEEMTAADLPAAVRDAVMMAYPAGVVGEVESEMSNGMTVYEVELMDGSREVEMKVSGDGTVLEVDDD